MSDPHPTAHSPRGGDPGLAAWPALVLTAGLGTRLRPLSLVRAKAALPVAGDVLVHRVLRWLRDAGVRRVVLNLHHLPETITPHVGDGSDLGLDVRYSWEPVVLGSAGGPRRARPLLDAERFLIVNGDTLTDASLTALTEGHLASGARVTMTVTPGAVNYGGVMADADNVVHGFARAEADRTDEATAMRPAELAALSRYHFVGIQAVEAEVFDDVRDDRPSETVRAVYPQLIAKRPGSVRIYRTDADFHDIGTPADYLATAMRFGQEESCRDTHVHPTARIPGCILWDRVTIGPGAELVDCIVADDVTIPAGERHRRQAIVLVDGRTIVTPL